MLPTITISADERAAGALSPETLSDAKRRLFTTGTLVLRGAFPTDLIAAMHAAFMARHAHRPVGDGYDDAIDVGDRRYMVTLDLEPPFDAPALYANPFASAVIAASLGPSHIMSSFGAVIALPGSAAQDVHRDFPPLFPETGLDDVLPAYAITLIVPLVDVDETVGTTFVWPGSHRIADFKSKTVAPEIPVLARGDCLFMDYRLVHGGSANRSAHARPIVYDVYCRPWFHDHVNYLRQPRVRVSRDLYLAVPEPHRHLFAQALGK